MSSLAPLPPTVRRRSRWPIYLPVGLMLGGLAACAAAWGIEREAVLRALDAAPAQAAASGVTLRLGDRTISGFPLRLRVEVQAPQVQGGAGWAAEAPRLVAQAYVFMPRRWVVVAPDGLTVIRPQGGALEVRGQALRASVAGLGRPDWRLVLEAAGARFAPAPGAHVFSLQSAHRIELDAKPAAQPGETAALLQVEGGVATPESAVWHVASGSPFDLAVSGRLSPGALALERLEAVGGPVHVSAAGGGLRADAEGRLEGAIPLRVRQAPQGPAAVPGTPAAVAIAKARAAGDDATLNLVFADGQARLGRYKLGPSPRVAP